MLSNTSIMPYQVITNTLSLLSNFINMFFGRGAPEGKLLSLEEGGQEKKMGNFSWPFLVIWDTKAPRGHIVPSDLFEARLPNEATRCFHLRKRSFEQTWANQSNCVTLIKKNIQRYSKPCTWKAPCNLKQVVCIVDVNTLHARFPCERIHVQVSAFMTISPNALHSTITEIK